MKSFNSFKDYIFKNLFPSYFHVNDTYKSSDPSNSNKGILERFIDICAEYFDEIKEGDSNLPGLRKVWDILDIDKTPEIFLNYFWEFLGHIPYAYGVIYYNREDQERWLNTANNFPQADTRNILKYAISLYKIRCTPGFYEILGRFYGVRFRLIDEEGESLTVATYSQGSTDEYSVYGDSEGGGENGVKAGFRRDKCQACINVTLEVDIPDGMYNLVQDRLDQLRSVFAQIINRYLPIWIRPLKESEVILQPSEITLIPYIK